MAVIWDLAEKVDSENTSSTDEKKINEEPIIPEGRAGSSVQASTVVTAPTLSTSLFSDVDEITLLTKDYYPTQQPFVSTIEFKIPQTQLSNNNVTNIVQNNTALSNILAQTPIYSQRPNNIIDFEYQRIGNCIGKFSIKLFDPTWGKLEEQLVKAKGNFGFRYGYTGDSNNDKTMSPWYTAKTLNYNLDFQMEGVVITLNGLTIGYELNTTKTFKGFEDKLISDIVKDIAVGIGFKEEDLVIEPTKKINTRDGIDTTDFVHKIFIKKGETNLAFIMDNLSKYAINEKEQGEYTFFIKLDKKGKKEFHYHTPWYTKNDLDKTPAFTLFKSPNSPLLNFKPKWNVTMLQLLGAGKSFSSVIDATTKETVFNFNDLKENAQGHVSKEVNLIIEDIKKNASSDDEASKAIEAFLLDSGQARCQEEMEAERLAAFSGYYAGALGGTIEIFGTTSFNVLDKIAVMVYSPSLGSGPTGLSKNVHWISGYFRILKIMDRISAGKFTTTMELVTDGRGTLLQDKVKTS